MNERCAIVLLAAGASTRMGEAKQLLPFGGTNLFNHSLQVALASGVAPVVVVYGKILLTDERHSAARFVHNMQWHEGIASSIRTGVNAVLQAAPQTDNIILMVCDQPYLSAELLKTLAHQRAATQKHIVACTYGDTTGTPVLFHKTHFPALQQLQGDEGAKKLIQQYLHDIATVPFPEGSKDIDTREDYEGLITF